MKNTLRGAHLSVLLLAGLTLLVASPVAAQFTGGCSDVLDDCGDMGPDNSVRDQMIGDQLNQLISDWNNSWQEPNAGIGGTCYSDCLFGPTGDWNSRNEETDRRTYGDEAEDVVNAIDWTCGVFIGAEHLTNTVTAGVALNGMRTANPTMIAAGGGSWLINRVIVNGCKYTGLGGGG